MDLEDRAMAKQRQAEWNREHYLYQEFDPDWKGIDHKKRYDLEDPEWRYDVFPEIMDGKNVFDFWAPDIEAKLDALEQEEAALIRRIALEQDNEEEETTLTAEQLDLVKKIRERRVLMVQSSRLKKGTTDAIIPRIHNTKGKSLSDFRDHLETLGLNGEDVVNRIRERSTSRSRSRSRPARERSVSESRMGRKRTRSEMVSTSRSKTPGTPGSGYRDEKQKELAERLAKRAKREMSRDGRRGESDRHVFDWKPKHLFSGKRGMGKTDRR